MGRTQRIKWWRVVAEAMVSAECHSWICHFPVRITKAWNELSDSVLNAPNVNIFKNRLDRDWREEDFLYNHKAPIPGHLLLAEDRPKRFEHVDLTNACGHEEVNLLSEMPVYLSYLSAWEFLGYLPIIDLQCSAVVWAAKDKTIESTREVQEDQETHLTGRRSLEDLKKR